MTFNSIIPGKRLYGHQVILLDEQGGIVESCDSIFDTSELLGAKLSKLFFFLESEFETIVKSKANKITFEKIQTESDFLPGYYDFTFSKHEINNQAIIIWEIYDYTKIYEQYINVQQITNELDIQEEFRNRESKPVFPESFLTKNFFQANYASNKKFDKSYLIDDLIRSKFDVFDLMAQQQVSQLIDLNPKDLKENLEFLIDSISTFLQNVKTSQEDSLNIRELSNTFFKNVSDIHFDSNLPEKVTSDKRILSQLIGLLCRDSASKDESEGAKVKVEHSTSVLGASSIIFSHTEHVQDLSTFLQNSVSQVIRLSVLKSLLSTIGGSLDSKYIKKELKFSVCLTFPVK